MNKIFFGDCREIMRRLIAEGIKVQMCVTSPPYFGLRDYGVDGQMGLEKTPEEYVVKMVETFRLVRDLLADDGTLWLNLGDTYANTGTGGHGKTGGADKSSLAGSLPVDAGCPTTREIPFGLKPKDLIGIPWRVAFALQADGWWLRQDIIWAKPNPMPESVTDRCTKSHEYIFLLSKSQKYYFDGDAIREPSVDPEGSRNRYKSKFGGEKANVVLGDSGIDTRTRPVGMRIFDGRRNKRSVWTVTTKPYRSAHFATFPPDLIEPCILAGSRPGDIVFDPFMGSGTTAQVALKHGRQYLGAELNAAYEKLHAERIFSVQPLLFRKAAGEGPSTKCECPTSNITLSGDVSPNCWIEHKADCPMKRGVAGESQATKPKEQYL